MSEYTDCELCKNITYNEERGHIVTFDHHFFMTLLSDFFDLLDLKEDIHIAIDVSKTDDPWELPCYHVTWRKNLPTEKEE